MTVQAKSNVRFFLIFAWAIFSIILIGGDSTEEMSFFVFFLIKLLGLISLGFCIIVGRLMDKAGLFPKFKEEDKA